MKEFQIKHYKDKQMKPSSAKAKGRKFQQYIRDSILLKFARDLENDDVKSTSMGAGGEDIQLSPAARKVMPISIECKHRKSIAIYSIFEQAQANSDRYYPVAAVKANGKKPLAVIDWDYFLDLMEAQYEMRKQSHIDEEQYEEGEVYEAKTGDRTGAWQALKRAHSFGEELDQDDLNELADAHGLDLVDVMGFWEDMQ